MKILIISDSHGNVANLNYVISNYKFDYIFYLGDGISDLGTLTKLDNVKFVKGNCDIFSNAKYEEIVKIGELKFLLLHGHTYNVKQGLGALINYAKTLGVNYVFFGHTHKHFNQEIDGITFLNPGSLSNLRGGEQSFVMLNIDNKKTLIEYIKI